VAGDEEHGAPRRIERESHPPDGTCGIEVEFLQVGVTRSLERIDSRPAQRRPELREHPGVGEQPVLDLAASSSNLPPCIASSTSSMIQGSPGGLLDQLLGVLAAKDDRLRLREPHKPIKNSHAQSIIA
jgi:hypothetical protein